VAPEIPTGEVGSRFRLSATFREHQTTLKLSG
jgi:hypothetical protein